MKVFAIAQSPRLFVFEFQLDIITNGSLNGVSDDEYQFDAGTQRLHNALGCLGFDKVAGSFFNDYFQISSGRHLIPIPVGSEVVVVIEKVYFFSRRAHERMPIEER